MTVYADGDPADFGPLTERELAWVEQSAGREPGSLLVRMAAEIRHLRAEITRLHTQDAEQIAQWRERAESAETQLDAEHAAVPRAGWGR